MVIFPFFLFFPIWALHFFIKYFSKLGDSNIQKRYGELTEGLNIHNRSMIIFWATDIVRRVLLSVIVVFFRSHFWLQNLVFLISTLAQVMVTGFTQARLSKFDQRLDYFNEKILLYMQYHIMCFTTVVHNPHTKFNIGYSCCVFIVVGVGVNMIMLIQVPI